MLNIVSAGEDIPRRGTGDQCPSLPHTYIQNKKGTEEIKKFLLAVTDTLRDPTVSTRRRRKQTAATLGYFQKLEAQLVAPLD